MQMAPPPRRPREGLAFRARTALRLDRFADLLEAVSMLVEDYGRDLRGDERDLICTAFNTASRQKSKRLQTLAAIEREDVCGDHTVEVNFFRELLELEMECVCQKGIKVLEDYLIPSCTTAEQCVLLLKMVGDLCWFQLSLVREANKQHLREKTVTSYEEGLTMCEGMGTAHPLKLSILLNLSAFYDEMGDQDRALLLAKHSIDEASQVLDAVDDKSLPVSATAILELMEENVMMWIANEVAKGYISSADSEPDKWSKYSTQPPSPVTSHNEEMEEKEEEQLEQSEAKEEVDQQQQQSQAGEEVEKQQQQPQAKEDADPEPEAEQVPEHQPQELPEQDKKWKTPYSTSDPSPYLPSQC